MTVNLSEEDEANLEAWLKLQGLHATYSLSHRFLQNQIKEMYEHFKNCVEASLLKE